MRLARYLAHAGVASRRGAESLIAAGAVSVAGRTVRDPALDVGVEDDVRVGGTAVRPETPATFALHKPVGVVSTARDTPGRTTVVDLVDDPARLYPVGRLDVDSSGLILLSNDGELANLLTHPRHAVPKTYRARVAGGPLSPAALAALRGGVELEDGPTAPCRVRRLARQEIELTLAEGRNRQVRRMCAAVGHPVRELARIAIGPLELGDLRSGEARRLTERELAALRAAAL